MSHLVRWPGMNLEDDVANFDVVILPDATRAECCEAIIDVGRPAIELTINRQLDTMIFCLPCFDTASNPEDGAIMKILR